MKCRVIQLSRRQDGKTYLSPDFQVVEFACKDGSDEILIDLRLVHILQRIRDHFGRPVVINSAYRTRDYNAKVGGVAGSQHVLGKAADIRVTGVAPSAVAAYAETLLPDSGGIGRYQTFTHIDTRNYRARWNG